MALKQFKNNTKHRTSIEYYMYSIFNNIPGRELGLEISLMIYLHFILLNNLIYIIYAYINFII